MDRVICGPFIIPSHSFLCVVTPTKALNILDYSTGTLGWMAMEQSKAKEEFDRCIDMIKSGITCYDSEAKRLAEEHGFPLDSLEEALQVGYDVRYYKFIDFLKEGIMSYESEARQLAEEHGFPVALIEKALQTGFERKYNDYVNFVKNGLICYETDARKLASEHGFSLSPLEDALEIAKQGESKKS